MRNFFIWARFNLAKTFIWFDERTARDAMSAASAHALANGMVDTVRGRLLPPMILQDEPVLLAAWMYGRDLAQRMRECVALETGRDWNQLQGEYDEK